MFCEKDESVEQAIKKAAPKGAAFLYSERNRLLTLCACENLLGLLGRARASCTLLSVRSAVNIARTIGGASGKCHYGTGDAKCCNEFVHFKSSFNLVCYVT